MFKKQIKGFLLFQSTNKQICYSNGFLKDCMILIEQGKEKNTRA